MTWKSIADAMNSSRFGTYPPATDEDAERMEFTLEAARHYRDRSMPISALARLVSGSDVWLTRRHLSVRDERNPEFMEFVDALVRFRAEERGDVITHQGILLREDIDGAMGREVIDEDGRRKIQFPVAVPWARPPIIKENGRVVDFGERGEPLYGKHEPPRPAKAPMKYWKPSLLGEE